MEVENAMMNLRLYMKRKLTFAVTFALLFCALFVFAAEVSANGNTSADLPVPEEPAIKKSVRRAPIKRPPKKAAAKPVERKRVHPEPPQPTSLEIGILMMEQERYEHAHLWLQKAVQEERHNPYAWYWYGMVHDKVGQYQQAQFFYARALALDPGLPPFSRVVAYPDDGDRKALWDPLRPARVYPVELGSRGVVIIPPDALEATPRPPKPYVDPSLPKVPVYVPPESPRDAAPPPVYVPPSFTGQSPVYAQPEQVMAPIYPIHTPPSHGVGHAGEAGSVYTPLPPVAHRTETGPSYMPPPPAVNQTGAGPVHMPPTPVTTPSDAGPVYTPPPPDVNQAGAGPVHMPPSPAANPGDAGPVYTPPPPPR